MEKVVLFSIGITLVFLILTFLENRYLGKEERSFKYILRDAIKVFLASMGILFLLLNYETYVNDFFSMITGTNITIPDKVVTFTGEPDF